MVFGAFYDPFVQEANRQLREIVIQRRYINESILFDFQQFLFNSLNNLCIRTLNLTYCATSNRLCENL